MVLRRLLGSAVDGVGFSAGAALFDKLKRDALEDLDATLPPEEEEAVAVDPARAAREAKAAAQAKARREKETAKEIDRELAAMKKRLAREK